MTSDEKLRAERDQLRELLENAEANEAQLAECFAYAELGALKAEEFKRELLKENKQLRERVALMMADGCDQFSSKPCPARTAGYKQGAAAERAAICAWLRGSSLLDGSMESPDFIANCIEAGEHSRLDDIQAGLHTKGNK